MKRANILRSSSEDSDNEESSQDSVSQIQSSEDSLKDMQSSGSKTEVEESCSSKTEDHDVEHDKKSVTPSKHKNKSSRPTPAKKSKIIKNQGSDSDEYEYGRITTPYKKQKRIDSDSDDEPVVTVQPKPKTCITGETTAEFEDSELDDIVVDSLKLYSKYNKDDKPSPSTVKTNLFDAVEGTDPCEVRPVIEELHESQEYSIGDLAEISDDSEELNLPKLRPHANKKMTLREKFHDYKESRRKISMLFIMA